MGCNIAGKKDSQAHQAVRCGAGEEVTGSQASQATVELAKNIIIVCVSKLPLSTKKGEILNPSTDSKRLQAKIDLQVQKSSRSFA